MHGHFGNVALNLVTFALLMFIPSVSVTLCVFETYLYAFARECYYFWNVNFYEHSMTVC